MKPALCLLRFTVGKDKLGPPKTEISSMLIKCKNKVEEKYDRLQEEAFNFKGGVQRW